MIRIMKYTSKNASSASVFYLLLIHANVDKDMNRFVKILRPKNWKSCI